MKNSTKLLIAFGGASMVFAISFFGASNGISLKAINHQTLSYGHYDAVLPSFDNPGSNEYWICCETHEIFFEKPFEGIIYSGGTPSLEEISTWESLNDGRYIKPIKKIDATHFEYGLYPQTHVSDSSLISSLNELTSRGASGFYELGGKFYEKSDGTPYEGDYRFDDGTAISYGCSYWYECEPIQWKILSSSNDEYFVLSEKLLDVVPFNRDCFEGEGERTDYEGNTATVYDNNYKYSDIRTFLNVDFLNKAFVGSGLNIKKTLVDNSVSTAYGNTNPYVCEDTNDKVFLLSYADIRNPSYFNVVESRCSVTSDFSRASGAMLTTNVKHPNCANFFARSPGTSHFCAVMEVDGEGYVDQYYADEDYVGLRPAMKMTIPA